MVSRSKKPFMTFLCLLTMGIIAGHANAIVLGPGDSSPLSGTTAGARPDLAAGPVKEDPATPFAWNYPGGGQAFSGVLQGRVFESSTLGTMVFAPRITDFFGDGSGWALLDVQISGFTGWSTDVDYSLDGLGDKGPGQASRSADADSLAFDFSADPLASGQDTYFLSVLTDAPAYDLVGQVDMLFANKQGSDAQISLRYFAPVPEPATLGLLLLGGLALLKRRRST